MTATIGMQENNLRTIYKNEYMDLNTIKNTANWGSSAANLNENFARVGTEVDKLKYAAYNSKLYATESLLKQAVPSPKLGDWAIVGDTIPGEIYQCKTDGVWTATGQTGGGYGMEVVEKNVTEQHITEVHNEYTGDIVNNPDDEDLYSEEVSEGKSVLKLADKAYNAAAFSGMGRAYLRKNITGGKNVLTQEMMGKANTRYVIQYDYDLNGGTVTVPEGCTLDFQGGSLRNGTVSGNNTEIISSKVRIFNESLCLSGSWNTEESFPQWFGAKGDGQSDDRLPIQMCLNYFKKVSLGNKTYLIDSFTDETKKISLVIPRGKELYGYSLDSPLIQSDETIKIGSSIIPNGIIKVNSNTSLRNIVISGNDSSGTIKQACVCSDDFVSGCNFQNVGVRHSYYGFDLTIFLSRLSGCVSSYCSIGFYLHGQINSSDVAVVEGTSVTINNCYTVDSTYEGYVIKGLIYSSMYSCAADGCGLGGYDLPITAKGFRIRIRSNNARHFLCLVAVWKKE